jgi:arylesterase / paraoxonase
MKKFFLILVLAISFFVLKTLYQAGQFKTIEDHFSGSVTTIYSNMPGPEDMQIDYSTGNMFISSSNRRPTDEGVNNDGIYLLNFDSGSIPVRLPSDFQGAFHPHGISLLRIDSNLYVFAVNHNENGNFVESFRFRENSLEHLASYSAPEMCCPNDLVATDVDKFYVTNDHGSKGGFMPILEDFVRIPRSSLMYFNGESFSRAAGPYNYANGVNISKDRSKLYLATTTGASVVVYDINEDATLHQINTVDLGTGVDNIDIDETGNLWVGAHPKLLDFLSHANDSTAYSPSQVIKLIPTDNNEFIIEEIYLNDGSEISGSSTAVYYHNELFVGVVFNHTLLRANLSK